MYGVLVCEDEDIIRRKIIQTIDWQANGFQPVLEANTGEEALKLFERNEIRILVSDIRMPGMDGLQLIERVKRCSPQTRVVVISGYSEFDYARTALRLSVYDYILKPFRSRKLLAVLLKLKGLIDDELARQGDLVDLHNRLTKSHEILRDRLVADLIASPATADLTAASTYLENQSLEEQPLFIAVVVMEPASSTSDPAAGREEPGGFDSLSEAVRDAVGELGLAWRVVPCGGGCVALVIPGRPEEHRRELAIFHELVSRDRGARATIGVGCTYSGLKNSWRSFHEAREAARQGFFEGMGKIYVFRDVSPRTTSLKEIVRVMQGRRIFEALRNGSFREIQREMAGVFDEVQSSSLEAASVRTIVVGLVLTASLALDEAGEDVTTIFGETFDPLAIAREMGSLIEARDWLISFFESIRVKIQQRRTQGNQGLIDEIRAFMNSNYREEVTLGDLASHFKISPSYISLLFKNHHGRTFSNYLSDLRIHKAMELLTYSDLRINEIAEEVGYRDPYYFSRSFKRLTGRSPREYRSNGR